jgi:hypothetical protein
MSVSRKANELFLLNKRKEKNSICYSQVLLFSNQLIRQKNWELKIKIICAFDK